MAYRDEVQVNMRFNADTSQARREIESLQGSLAKVMASSVTNTSGAGMHLTKDLQAASLAAAQLQATLQKAMNVNTGKLDLKVFNEELRKSGMSLEKYQQTLSKAGPTGKQAFTQLAHSITTADLKVVRANEHLAKLGQSLMNTARWQISSSILTGFISSIQKAYRYVEDLNGALNDIRIVTGANIKEMDEFAEKANKAAKALNTTTVEYAKASLIYYQQGLNPDEVEQRTNLTIKMANVTGQSAQEVSNQLTAVWNNFYDGSRTLEYYIDVMTALGAATASSSEEISEGLNKFASVAETVGLSYEYAAAALATVTATTRQSADIVGNAFKTLFARIQGLNLGETQDDGTTLNKYAQALDKVGINIKTSSGEIKEMNTILDEMGSKWQSLAEDEQIALAQSVAGVRQYTQLIALMENWEYFKQNVNVAANASGTLSEQAEIQAESWEAARDRVTAALESIYQKLLDDDAFIGILNFFEKFLTTISNVIDNLGGLQGVLLLIGTTLTRVFQQQAAAGMVSLAAGIKSLTPAGKNEVQATQNKANELLVNSYSTKTMVGRSQGASAKSMGEANQVYLNNAKNLNETQRSVLKMLVDQQHILAQAAIDQGEVAKQTERQEKSLVRQVKQRNKGSNESISVNEETAKFLNKNFNFDGFETNSTTGGKFINSKNNDIESLKNQVVDKMTQSYSQSSYASEILNYATFESGEFDEIRHDSNSTTQQQLDGLEELQNRLKNLGVESGKVSEDMQKKLGPELTKSMEQYSEALDKAIKATKELKATQEKGEDIGDLGKEQKDVIDKLEGASAKFAELTDEIREMGDRSKEAGTDMGMSMEAAGEASKNTGTELGRTDIKAAEAAEGVRGVAKGVEELNKQSPTKVTEGFMNLASSLGTATTLISSIIGLFDVWNNEDMTFGEKIISTLTTIGMLLPLAISSFSALTTEQTKAALSSIKAAFGFGVEAAAAGGATVATTGLTVSLFTLQIPIGWLIVAIGALTLLLVGLAKAWHDSYHAEAIALEEAGKRVEELTDHYTELKNAADELKTSISDYSDALKALKDLEKGTDEYKAKIEEVNTKAKELIETYGLWNDFTYENGIIAIDEDALVELQSEAESIANRAKAQMYGGEIQFNNADLDYKANQIARKDIGTIYNEYNNIVAQDSLKDKVTELAKAMDTLKEKNGDVELSQEQLKEALKAQGAELGVSTLVLNNLDAFINDKSLTSLWDFTEAINQATAANEYYAQQIFQQNLSDEIKAQAKAMATDAEGNFDENKYNQILAILANQANENTKNDKGQSLSDAIAKIEIKGTGSNDSLEDVVLKKDEYEKAIKDLIGEEYINKDDMSDEQSALAFARAKFGEGNYSHVDGIGVSGIKNLDTGETLFEDMNDEAIRRELERMIKQRALELEFAELSNENTEQFANALNEISSGATEFGKKYGVDFSGAIVNAISNKNYDSLDMSSLYSQISPKEYDELMQIAETPQELMKVFGINEDQLIDLGYTNASQWAQAFQKGLEDWKESDYTDAINADFEAQAESLEIDVEEFKIYRQLLLDTNKVYRDNVEGLNQVALANKRMQRGAQALADDWDEFNNIISKENVSLEELSSILPGINIALQNILNLDTEQFTLLPPTFAQDNWALIQDVVNGVEGAVNELRNKAGEEILVGITGAIDIGNVDSVIQQLHETILQADLSNFEIGIPIDEPGFISACNNILAHAKMTQQQAEAYFQGMGYNVEVTTDKNGFATAVKVITPNGSYGGGVGVKTTATGIKKDTRKLDEEIDRYHEINELLDDLNRQYDQISKAKDRAFGANKIALMDLEIAKTQELANAQKQYISEIQENLKIDKSALMGYGAEFDESGRISNYEDLMKNNIGLDEESWNKFKEILSQYEETLNSLEAEQIEFIDLQNQMFDLLLEKIQYEVEVKVNVNDRELRMLEYQLEQLNDPLYDAAENITKLGESIDLNLKNSDEYVKGIKKILGETIPENDLNQILNGNFDLLANYSLSDSQISAVEEYIDALYDTNGNLDTLYESVGERVNGAFEELNKQMGENVSTLSHLGGILNNFRNIVDLVGKDVLGLSNESMTALSEAMTNNAINTVEANKKILDTNKQALEEAKAERAKAEQTGDMKAVAEWDKTIATISETVKQNENDMFSSLSEALQAAADQYKTTMEGITETFEESMSGSYGSLAAMQEAYDQQSELSELYVKDYEKIYELSKLNRDINKSIDGTSNVKAKQELVKLQEEINELSKDDAKVSEYDLEHLRKKYDLRLAEIALEEAQNAKSQVRMQRDSEGNWSYVYTADEERMAEAQQNYEDKLFALQDLNEKYIQEQEEALLQLQQDYVNAINNIHVEDYETYEEYLAAIEQVNTHYNALFEARGVELGKAIDNNKQLYENESIGYKFNNDRKISSDVDLTTSFEDTTLALVGGYSSISGMQETFKIATSGATAAMGENYNNWKTNVGNAMGAAGLSLSGFEGQFNEAVININTKSDEATTSLDEIALSGAAAFKSIVDAAADQYTTYSDKIDEYKNKNLELIQTLNTIIEKAGEVNNLEFTTETPGSNPNVDPSGGENLGTAISRFTDKNLKNYVGSVNVNDKNIGNYQLEYNPQTGNYALFEKGSTYAHYISKNDATKLQELGINYKTRKQSTTVSSIYALSGIAFNGMTKTFDFTEETAKNLKRSSDHGGSYIYTDPTDNRVYKFTDEDSVKALLEYFGLTYKQPSKQTEFTINNSIKFRTVNKDNTLNQEMSGSALIGKTFIVKKDAGNGVYFFEKDYEDLIYYALKEELRKGGAFFDTGGYTGSWDSSGRLAVLHEKELVLNKNDTSNFLEAINMIREIDLNTVSNRLALLQDQESILSKELTDRILNVADMIQNVTRTIELNALAQTHSVEAGSLSVNYESGQTLQQEVIIRAEFPNASNHFEIEEAFDNLINRASQFALRKNK